MTTQKSKTIWTSKTFWFNVITGLAAAMESAEVVNVVPQELHPYIFAFIAAGNIILRTVTTQPAEVTNPVSNFMTVPKDTKGK